MPDYDVIVVGGGPAGSMAAYYAAKGGAKTLLLEKDREIGLPVRCGEAVSKEGLKQFLEPDPRWIAATITRIRMRSPDATPVTFTSKAVGYVLHRRLFDPYLAHRAARAGAEIQTRAYVHDLLLDDDRVRGVKFTHLGKEFELTAHLVIGADGVESRIGRMAGLRTALKIKDIESCFQVTVGNLDIPDDLIEFYVGSNWAPGGYLWIFPKGDGTANLGLGISGEHAQAGKAQRMLEDFLKTHYPEARILNMICGGVPVAPTLKRFATDGLMLTGDAAHMVNPLTGGGIVSGMHGGKLAGETAVEALAQGDFSAAFLQRYAKRWMKVGGNSHLRLYKIARTVSSLTTEELNSMAATLSALPEEKLGLFTIFKEAAKLRPAILLDVAKAFVGL